MLPDLNEVTWSAPMPNPLETSDAVLARYLGSSLQSATVRLIGGLIVFTAVVALVVKIL
jgi:hypothetical protein